MSLRSVSGVLHESSGEDLPPRKTQSKRAVDAKDSQDKADRSTKLDNVRDKMRAGYYKSKEVDDAITDKISGAFDRLA